MAWTDRYISVAGGGAHDGTSEANAWTFAEAIAAYAAGQRLNMIAGTYANTTTSRTFATAGTTTAPVWWRGYKTAIGDMDAQPTATRTAATDIPSITFTTGQLLVTTAHHILSNIDISGAATAGAQVAVTGGAFAMDRCRVENTGANAASSAISTATGGGNKLTRSWFKASSSATRVVHVAALSPMFGCVATGGGVCFDTTNQLAPCIACVARSAGSDGFQNTGGNPVLVGCTSYGAGRDGIRISTVANGYIIACIFANSTGIGINNSSGTNTNVIVRLCNSFWSNTGGNEVGFGDSPSLQEVLEVASPFTNAAGLDLSLLASALAKAAGLGLFENETFQSYLDIGAVQRPEQGLAKSIVYQNIGTH